MATDYYSSPEWQQQQAMNAALQAAAQQYNAASPLLHPDQQTSDAQMSALQQSLSGAYQNYANAPNNPQVTQSQSTADTSGGVVWPGAGVGRLTLRNQQTGEMQTLDASQYQRIGQLTGSGWTPLNPQGQPYRVVDYGGGQMYIDPARPNQPMPLNVMLGGQPSAEQTAAMPTFMQYLQTIPQSPQTPAPPPSAPPMPGAPPTPPTTGMNPFTTQMPSGLSAGNYSGMDFQALINALIGESVQQGAHGQESLQSIRDSLNEFLQGARENAANQGGQQNALTLQNMGMLLPGMQNAIAMLGQQQGGMTPEQLSQVTNWLSASGPALGHAVNNMMTPLDQTQGLPAGALAALQTNALDQTSRSYDQSMGALKSQLLRSGAQGMQDTPGSLGDIVRGYGGLESERVGQQSQLLANAQLANAEAQRQNYGLAQQTGLGAVGQAGNLSNILSNTFLQNAGQQLQGLGLSNQTALGAMNTGQNLIGTIGNIYNPTNYLNAAQGAYGNLLGTTQQGTAAGLGGLQNATGLMTAMAGQQSGNSGLLQALIGGGLSALGSFLGRPQIRTT